jgi:hypothetical protein
MAQSNNSTSQPHISLVKLMLAGAAIGLLLISTFLILAGEPNPEWGKLWMIRPLIVVPMAGAMGGLCNYYIVRFHNQVGLNRAIAISFGVVVFIVGLWLGIILGLDGTLWD